MGQGSSTEAKEDVQSGVRLAPELEGKIRRFVVVCFRDRPAHSVLCKAAIIRDFQNQTIQEEWNKFRAGVLVRRNDRRMKLSDAAKQQMQEREVRAVQRQQRMASLDQAIDEMKAKFADDSIALKYDADNLTKRFEKPAPKEKPKILPCLGPRAHWMDCIKKYAVDPRPCDAYLATLEKCVNETIVKRGATPEPGPTSRN